MVKRKKTIEDKDKLKFIDLETLKGQNINNQYDESELGSSTPYYCPPEILTEKSQQSIAMDLWALAYIFYYSLYHVEPFTKIANKQ